MATPPFSLNTSAPGNTDVAAVFPTLDRGDKDVIQSWFLTSGNVQGRNALLSLDKVGSTYGPSVAPSPGANVASIYYDTDNNYKIASGDIGDAPEILGVPPGTILDYAGTTAPPGYILLTGTPASVQNVSRTTFARLFAVLGLFWGNGDGSTTFGLPPGDRMFTGLGNGAGIGGLATNGGAFTITLTQAQLPAVSYTLSSTSTQVCYWGGNSTSFSTPNAGGTNFTMASINNMSANNTIVGTIGPLGSAAAVNNMPKYSVVNKIIKF